jgi:VIT1/CCC1 family predicted Fe2+/Mn2+ transporter
MRQILEPYRQELAILTRTWPPSVRYSLRVFFYYVLVAAIAGAIFMIVTAVIFEPLIALMTAILTGVMAAVIFVIQARVPDQRRRR